MDALRLGNDPVCHTVAGLHANSSGIISCMGLGLLVIYWYTRQTTTGISQTGTMISVMGTVLVSVTEFVWEDESVWYFVVFSGLLGSGVALLQIRAVQPFTIAKEGSKWTIRRWRWTHRERATRRLDPSWLYALGVSDSREAWFLTRRCSS